MSEWQVHWFEAEGSLDPWRDRIAAEIEATHAVVSGLTTPPRLDILVQRLPGWVIPEIGMVGHSYRRGLFSLTLDPDNPNFAGCLIDGTLRRQVAHEVHHCLRMGVVGYPQSLGDALVSEGLAGHFVHRLFDSPPEPWERAVETDLVKTYYPDEAAPASPNYDYNAWFYGDGGRFPRWTGYTLGYMIVGRWLETAPPVDGATLVGIAVADVLSAWRAAG